MLFYKHNIIFEIFLYDLLCLSRHNNTQKEVTIGNAYLN